MPVSVKKVISHISGSGNSFSRKELYDILAGNTAGSGKQRKGRSRKKYSSHRDIRNIDEAVSALASIGLLTRKGKTFRKKKPFSVTGTMHVNTRGSIIVSTDTGYDVSVDPEKSGSAHNMDRVAVTITDFRRGDFRGSVDKILKRNRSLYAGRVVKKTGATVYYSVLDMPGQAELCSERSETEPETGDFVMMKLTGRMKSNRPECVPEQIFKSDDESCDIIRITARHSLPGPHPEYEELKGIEQRVPDSELKNRKDYRSLYTITIDGADAKDFDDALSIQYTGESTRVFIHIADVSAYVPMGSVIDREANKRGTSIYLGSGVIPMFPERLSNDLCSLVAGKDRYTMTAEISFDNESRITGCAFHRGIINTDRRLTYTQSAKIMDSEPDSETGKVLNRMHELAKALKADRLRNGRIDMNLNEGEMVFDENRIRDIVKVERLKSHMIIEEFMLSANEAVSRELRKSGVPTLFRIHEKTDRESLISIRQFLRGMGIPFSLKGNIGLNIQNILDSISGREYEHVINLLILKSMMQAYYGPDQSGHFGLGFEDYTHFTSPIRRYPDLVVHRCLKSLIDKTGPPYTRNELVAIGEKSSEMERTAQKAERDMVKLKSCRIMAERTGEVFPVIISGISRSGLFVTLAEKPVEGMIPMRALTDDFYVVMEDDYTVVGRKYGKRFRLGDRIFARLTLCDSDNMRIDFEPVQGDF